MVWVLRKIFAVTAYMPAEKLENIVTPVKAGANKVLKILDSHFLGNDI
jgi:hypothetical protein